MTTLSLFRLLFISVIALIVSACDSENTADSSYSSTDAVQQQYNWKMVTTWPPGFPVLQEGAERFAENVSAMSNGRLNIKVYAGGELIPALQTFDAVSQGTV